MNKSAVCIWLPVLILYQIIDLGLFVVVHKGIDWAPLWAGTRLALTGSADIYDFALVTKLQTGAVGELLTTRPFVYPPSALIFFAPFAILPFHISLVSFVTATGLLYLWASRRIGADWSLFFLPPVVLAALAGQTTFAVAGLTIAALPRLRHNPALAGVLLAAATSIKPTLFILAPIALIGGGHYRVLLVWMTSGLAIVATSVILFGHHIWLNWVSALPRFSELFLSDPSLVRNAVTPYAALARIGIDSPAMLGFFAAVSVIGVVLAFKTSEDAGIRLVALFGGALLMVPYAMNYELALLAPAVAAVPAVRLREALLLIAFSLSLIFAASWLGLLVVIGYFCLRLKERDSHIGREDACGGGVPSAG